MLRQTSLTRSDMCLSPSRGLKPQPINPQESVPHKVNREVSRQVVPLRDEELSQRPKNRRSIPPTESRRSQSVSDLTSDVSHSRSPVGNAGQEYQTKPGFNPHAPATRFGGASMGLQGNEIRKDLEQFVQRKRKSLERQPGNSPGNSQPGNNSVGYHSTSPTQLNPQMAPRSGKAAHGSPNQFKHVFQPKRQKSSTLSHFPTWAAR